MPLPRTSRSGLLPETFCVNPVALRKVRWGRAGSGKSGGVRVIYFTRSAEGELVFLTLFAKGKTDNFAGPKLKEIRRALED